MQPGRALAAGMRSRGGAGLGCRLRVMVRKGVRTPRGRSLFSRGKVQFGECQTPGRRIVVDCPFLNCCGCLGRSAGQAVVRRAGPVGLCLCRCGLCHEFEWPQTAAVLDDRVRLGAGEVNRFGNMLTELLCGGGRRALAVCAALGDRWGLREGAAFCGATGTRAFVFLGVGLVAGVRGLGQVLRARPQFAPSTHPLIRRSYSS